MKKAQTSKTFNVHIFAVARVTVPHVEASSHEEAIRKAVKETNLHHVLDDANGCDVGYAEEISSYLVDVVGDQDYAQSRSYWDAAHRRDVKRGLRRNKTKEVSTE